MTNNTTADTTAKGEAGAVAWRHLVHIGGNSHVWTRWTEDEVCDLPFGTGVRTECAYSQATVDVLRAQLEDVEAERDRLREQIEAVWAAMPKGVMYLDPPDGGDVPLHEQVRRMGDDVIEQRARADKAEADLKRLRESRLQLVQDHSDMRDRAEQAEADANRYRWLRDSTACSLTVNQNDHHNTYQSVEQTFWNEGYYEDVSDAERKKMIETDTIWTVHIYPRTPVGFDVYHAATLDAAIDAAKAATP